VRKPARDGRKRQVGQLSALPKGVSVDVVAGAISEHAAARSSDWHDLRVPSMYVEQEA
jgi:hypothetical protein